MSSKNIKSLLNELLKREMEAKVLDSMDIEKERGITIKAQTATMNYKAQDSNWYQFNLYEAWNYCHQEISHFW